MRHWFKFERRLRDDVMNAMIPRWASADDEEGLPGIEDLDLEPFYERLGSKAPRMVGLGFQAAVWLFLIAPLIWLGSFRPFRKLPSSRKQKLLERVAVSKLYVVRQMMMVLKTLACLAYLRDPVIRELVDERSRSS